MLGQILRRLPLMWIGLASLIVTSVWTRGLGASQFDGHWAVMLQCPPSPDGALPFTFSFAADVAGGVLRGQHGTLGQPGSLSLDGTIQSDGSAQIKARGITGQSAYNLNRTARGIPYEYDVAARFTPTQGTGSWVAKRTCSFTFTR